MMQTCATAKCGHPGCGSCNPDTATDWVLVHEPWRFSAAMVEAYDRLRPDLKRQRRIRVLQEEIAKLREEIDRLLRA